MTTHGSVGFTNYDMLRDMIRDDIVSGVFPPGTG